MSKRTLLLLVVLLLAVASYYAFTQLNPPPSEEEDGNVLEGESMRIAAFNVQVFGKTRGRKRTS